MKELYDCGFMSITPERLARVTAIFLPAAASDTTLLLSEGDGNHAMDSDTRKCDGEAHDRCSHNHRKRKRYVDRYERNAGIPSHITKRMELNEWAVSLLFVDHVHPSQQLSALIDEFFVVNSEDNICVNLWQNRILSVINEILLKLLSRASCDNDSGASRINSSILPTTLSITTTGYVDIVGTFTVDVQFVKATVALYYHSLEAILCREKIRKGNCSTSETSKEGCSSITITPKVFTEFFIREESFHRALVACCYFSISKAVSVTQKIRPAEAMYTIPIYSLLQNIVQCSSYEFLKTSEFFFIPSQSVHSEAYNQLGSPFIFTLPRRIVKNVQEMETNIIDSLLWACNSPLQSVDTLTHHVQQMQDTSNSCFWPPKCLASVLPEEVENATNTVTVSENDIEHDRHDVVNGRAEITTTQATDSNPATDHRNRFDFHVVEFIINKLLSTAYTRIHKLCAELRILQNSLDEEPMIIVSQQMIIVFRFIVRNYIHLFYDRHLDHWILCTIYGVTRSIKYQPELKFAQIISAYVSIREDELGTATCQQIVRHVKLVNTDPTGPKKTSVPMNGNTQQDMGNVISLYNKVFVPKMKDYLLNSHSLRLCSMKLAQLQRKD